MSNKDTLVQVVHDSISIAQDCDYMDSSELVESLRILATQTAILANCMIEMQNNSIMTKDLSLHRQHMIKSRRKRGKTES